MENKPKIILNDSNILKAMLQMNILHLRCKLTPPQTPESSDSTKIDKPSRIWGGSCPCVHFKLETDICHRLSKTKLILDYLENNLLKTSMDGQNTQSITSVKPITEFETASNDKQMETNDEKKTITEPEAIFLNNSIDIKVVKKNDDTYDQFLTNHINVFGCAWSKCSILDLICIRERDNTAHICDVIENNKTIQVGLTPCIQKEGTKIICKSITCVEWKPNDTHSQTHLVTGTYDGYAQVWKTDGKNAKCLKTLVRHEGPILALKWNKKGNYILSAGIDSTAIIWDASSGQVIKQFKFHTKPILDIDWNTKRSFASCGIDKNIHVCRLGCDQPVQTFLGHTDIVHTIKWDPQGKWLVSCSKDKTMKLWSLKRNAFIHNLRGHSCKITSVIWSPTGPGSENPNKKLMLASASLDSTIRLWDVERGLCVKTLRKHTGPVTCLDFSPDGRLLISGGLDKFIHIWSTHLEQVVCSFEGSTKIAEVHWNPRHEVIAAMALDGSVFLLDLRSQCQ